jgi:hypothetical protein
MKYIHVYAPFLMSAFITSCGQNQTEGRKIIIISETKGVITSHGPNTSVRAIRQDRKGTIWLASNEGIIRYDGKSLRNFTTIPGLADDGVLCIYEDRTGIIWFCIYSKIKSQS